MEGYLIKSWMCFLFSDYSSATHLIQTFYLGVFLLYSQLSLDSGRQFLVFVYFKARLPSFSLEYEAMPD